MQPIQDDRQEFLPVRPVESGSMMTRDGVRLDADIYRPAASGDYPVLLMRQAYGRRIASTVCYAHPAWYAAHGYVVVVQDVRGRGTSEGTFALGEHERADGADAVAWASALDGTTGEVGMYGFSYQGYTQLMAALDAGPELKAVIPAMAPWDGRTTWAFENGAFRFQGNLSVATQMAAETARRNGDAQAYAELQRASRGLPVLDARPARPASLERHLASGHYRKWLDTPLQDPYWDAISPGRHVDRLAGRQLPMLFVGGWYDTHLHGVLSAFRSLSQAGARNLELVVGPWVHIPWARRVGDVDFGPHAHPDTDRLNIGWFDLWLKGKARDREPDPVRLFDLGAKVWRGFRSWPEAPVRWGLSSGGKAAIDTRDGRLDRGKPAPSACQTDRLVHDPWRPAPTVGGAFGSPPGPIDRRDADARGDVLTFTSAPLSEEITLAGNVAADLSVSCDAGSVDLSCVLSRVAPTGQVHQIAEGYASFGTVAGRSVVTVPMRATCATLAAGEALRLSVALASFPAYPVNPGTGVRPTDAAGVDAQIITLDLDLGGETVLRTSVAVQAT